MVDEVTKVQTIDYGGVYPAVVEEVVNREDAAGLSLGALHTQRAFAHWTDQFQLGRRNWLAAQPTAGAELHYELGAIGAFL